MYYCKLWIICLSLLIEHCIKPSWIDLSYCSGNLLPIWTILLLVFWPYQHWLAFLIISLPQTDQPPYYYFSCFSVSLSISVKRLSSCVRQDGRCWNICVALLALEDISTISFPLVLSTFLIVTAATCHI